MFQSYTVPFTARETTGGPFWRPRETTEASSRAQSLARDPESSTPTNNASTPKANYACVGSYIL